MNTISDISRLPRITEHIPVLISRAINELSPETRKEVLLLLGVDESINFETIGDDAKKFAENMTTNYKWHTLLQLDDPILYRIKGILGRQKS